MFVSLGTNLNSHLGNSLIENQNMNLPPDKISSRQKQKKLHNRSSNLLHLTTVPSNQTKLERVGISFFYSRIKNYLLGSHDLYLGFYPVGVNSMKAITQHTININFHFAALSLCTQKIHFFSLERYNWSTLFSKSTFHHRMANKFNGAHKIRGNPIDFLFLIHEHQELRGIQ